MVPNYDDIRTAIERDPDWFGSNGVPRYAPFAPDMLGVYDKFALLVEIHCQACSQPILVGQGWSLYDRLFRADQAELPEFTLETVAASYGYGDPPWHGCPGPGESMSSISVRVVEAWERDRTTWERRPDVESLDVYSDWAR